MITDYTISFFRFSKDLTGRMFYVSYDDHFKKSFFSMFIKILNLLFKQFN